MAPVPNIGDLLSKHQIAALFNLDIGDGRGGYGQWGVWHLRKSNELVLVVTLDHTKRPTAHRYTDHFESPEILVWQSQPTTEPDSEKGRDYIEQQARRLSVHLYARGDKFGVKGQNPFLYLGLVDQVGWTGSSPMTIRWRLRSPVPSHARGLLAIPIEREPREIATAQDWQQLEPEAAADFEALRLGIQEGRYRAEDEWTLARKRAGQAAFREEVLRAHGGKCAVCQLSEPRLLDACHIVPWSDDADNRLNPANGLALCVLHHRALDRGILYISATGEIKIEQGGEWARSDAGLVSLRAFESKLISGPLDQLSPFLLRAAAKQAGNALRRAPRGRPLPRVAP